MSDPVTGAIVGAVANHSISKLRELIETSDSPEETWKQSCGEIAIKIRTSYRQNQEVDSADDDRFSRDLERYGDMARELAVYGEVEGFESDYRQKVAQLADGCANTARSQSGVGNTLASKYQEEEMASKVDSVIEGAPD